MSDYVLARKSRNVVSKTIHIFLNILLGVGTVLVTVLSGSPILGIVLVLASKWRVFAVRLRYLWTNIKANLVDVIVGISVVLLAYSAGSEFLLIDFILMIFYSCWLLFIKPLSGEIATMIQGLIAVFLGMSAVGLMTAGMEPLIGVIFAFIIGYAASRHILIQENEKDFKLSTLITGLVFAEITWLCSSWAIVYPFWETGIRIPQVAIILTIYMFVYDYVRRAAIKYQEELKFKHIAGPVIFGIILIGIVVLGFSVPIFNI